MTGPGLYDPTNIMNSDTLSKAMKEGWIKLGVYLISFFYYLYGWVWLVNLGISNSFNDDDSSLISEWSHRLSQHNFSQQSVR